MLALLGVLAVAGYQNREKLGELLGGAGGRRPGGAPDPNGGAAGGGIGAMIGDGLRDIVERFRQAGQGEAAESWVASGPNRDVTPPDLERAIGTDTLDDLARQTGLPRQEIIARLTRSLPGAVDGCTPAGCLPAR